ncbi:MAG: T9SS type A sorting domain-containing protein [Bacteroidetes bacterium]|nr:T9SS type A sorting domain-containing protein [Bacteroidota bacterium]
MKKILLPFFLSILSLSVFAQLENTHWCFGYHARVDFNAASPSTPPTVSSSAVYNNPPNTGGYSGSGSSVSDANGNLLFYTDALSVWDKNDTEMPNGTQLFGTTEQVAGKNNSLIVPKPDHPGVFYVFTLSTYVPGYPPIGTGGAHYTVVNANLPGNTGPLPGPNGEVIASQKNIALNTQNNVPIECNYNGGTGLRIYGARIGSTLHADGDKIWVTINCLYNQTGANELWSYTYLITTNGFYDGVNYYADGTSPKPYSSIQLDNTIYSQVMAGTYAELKFSPDGTHLADIIDEGLVLYDFDKQTGVLTFNSKIFTAISNPWGAVCTNGVEFSPNSSLLYFSGVDYIFQNRISNGPTKNGTNHIRIFQYALKTNVTEQVGLITLTDSSGGGTDGNVITPLPAQFGCGLQLGIDNKIYACVSYPTVGDTYHLGVINYPDIQSTGCQFVVPAVDLISTYHLLTLPHWVQKPAVHMWPKVYDGIEPCLCIKGDNPNNLVAYMILNNMANNINHYGEISTSNSTWIHYGKSDAKTSWIGSYLPYGGYESSGNEIQLFQSSAEYRDITSGVISNGPNYVPRNEKIIAEDNGTYVTSYLDNTAHITALRVYAPPSIIPVDVVSIPLFNNSSVGIDRVFFNPSTKHLFVSYNYLNLIGSVWSHYLGTYTLINNNLSNNNPQYYPINTAVIAINSAEQTFVLLNGSIQYCDYVNNTYTILNLNGNTNLTDIGDFKQTLEDKIVAADFSIGKVYCFNTNPFNRSSKSVSISTNPSNPYDRPVTSYYVEGDDVYLGGGFQIPSFSISTNTGVQTMPLLGSLSTFITKLNFQTDFTLRTTLGNPDSLPSIVNKTPVFKTETNNIESNYQETLNISPNPVKDVLRLSLKNSDTGGKTSGYVEISNTYGQKILIEKINSSLVNINVSKLKSGLYFITYTILGRGKITRTFLKE